MRLLAPAALAMASTRAPVSPLAVNSAVAAARIAARVRQGIARDEAAPRLGVCFLHRDHSLNASPDCARDYCTQLP